MIKTRTGGRQDYIMNQYEIIFGLKEGEPVMDLFGFMHVECLPPVGYTAYGTWALTFTSAVYVYIYNANAGIRHPTNNFVVLFFGYISCASTCKNTGRLTSKY